MSVLASQSMGQSLLASCKNKGQSVIQIYKAATCTVIRSLLLHLEIKCKHMHKPKCYLGENHCPDNTEWEWEGKKNQKYKPISIPSLFHFLTVRGTLIFN